MKQQVDFSRKVGHRAGKKSPYSRGLELNDDNSYISENGKNVTIFNINAKDGFITTDLRLSVPKENIPELIEALKRFI